jgi:lipocalin
MSEIFQRQAQLNSYDISDLEMTDQSCHTGLSDLELADQSYDDIVRDWNPVVAPSVSLDTLISQGPYYTIASKPILIEKYCKCSLVTYSWKQESHSSLNLNESCVIFGSRFSSVSEGVPQDETNARWKNIQSGIISAPYYILEVANDYSYIVFGSTNTYLWLLSKTPTFDSSKTQEIFARQVTVNGYDISDLETVDQSCFAR